MSLFPIEIAVQVYEGKQASHYHHHRLEIMTGEALAVDAGRGRATSSTMHEWVGGDHRRGQSTKCWKRILLPLAGAVSSIALHIIIAAVHHDDDAIGQAPPVV